jgi:hypothetical protein
VAADTSLTLQGTGQEEAGNQQTYMAELLAVSKIDKALIITACKDWL